MQKRKTVREWQEQLETLRLRNTALELAVYDAYRGAKPDLDVRVGEPITVKLTRRQVRVLEGDDMSVEAIINRPFGSWPYVVIVCRGDGNLLHVEHVGLEDWYRQPDYTLWRGELKSLVKDAIAKAYAAKHPKVGPAVSCQACIQAEPPSGYGSQADLDREHAAHAERS